MKGKLQTTAALLGALFLLAIFVQGQSAELKERFLQRLPLLENMKDQGWVGENNLGFLAFLSEAGQSKENTKVVNAENQDRKTVYAEIAVKVNASAEAVGRRRAVQIATLAAVGHWLQDSEDNWYQKKQ